MAVPVATPTLHLHPGLHPLLEKVAEVPPGPFVQAGFQVEALERLPNYLDLSEKKLAFTYQVAFTGIAEEESR